jgi:flavin-dependent dehydrogenase
MVNNSADMYDFVIVGAGIAGAKAFFHFSQLGSCVLLEKLTANAQIYQPLNAKVVCGHSFPWMEEAPFSNIDIFPRDHWKSMYASQSNQGIVSGHEFGKPLGKITHLSKLIKWYLEQGQTYGGQIFWECSVQNVSSHAEHMELIADKGNKFRCRLLIVATGSKSFNLHEHLSLPIPKTLNTISITFKGSKSTIENNIPVDYMFQLHPQISTTGMLWMNRALTFFNIGFVSLESIEIMTEKFLRILQNYKPIQNFFKDTTPYMKDISPTDFQYGTTTKYPIGQFSTHRTIVLGDAGGLFYSLYLEGILGASASAKLAATTIEALQKQKRPFTASNLKQYDNILRQKIIKPYFKAGTMGDSLFFNGKHEKSFTIWDSYVEIIKNLKQVRKNIFTAYTWQDLEHYPIENDVWCGEQIYKNLPLGKRIALTPIFLKQKLIH